MISLLGGELSRRASPYLALDAIRGERVFVDDRVACDHFDFYVLRRAADLEPFERARRELLLQPTAPPKRPGP